MFDAVWPLLNNFARIPVCGLIAHYNDTGLRRGLDRLPLLMRDILVKRLTFRGFIVIDFQLPIRRFHLRHERLAAGRTGQVPRRYHGRNRKRSARTDRPAERREFRQEAHPCQPGPDQAVN